MILLSVRPVTATERPVGTPRIARALNLDRSGAIGGPFATSAASDTTTLAAWRFDAGPGCNAQGWTTVDLTAGVDDFGNHAGQFPAIQLVQQDACAKDLTCVWAFIANSTTTYACGGFPLQTSVPIGSDDSGYIWNEIWSPAVNLTGSGSQFQLRFTVYRQLELRNLVFYTWRLRSITSGVASEWKHRDDYYYGFPGVYSGEWYRQVESIGDLIDKGADQIQVALGVVDMGGPWSGLLGDGGCHSHAPLFDTVDLLRVDVGGPQWAVEPIDLFQDNFAGDGTVTGTVRTDIARDINPRDQFSIRPGDSVVVSVDEPTVGLDFDAPGAPESGPAVYLYVRDVSPEKSGTSVSGGARWPVRAQQGDWTILRFDSVRTPAGIVPDRYCVDLNDELFTPGDTIEFYFSARDAAGRVTYWTEFIGTTSSSSDARAAAMEMTCLPVSQDGNRAILYIDDADGSGAQAYFDVAFAQISRTPDRYDVRGPDCLAGNGPGSRVRDVAIQVAGVYESVIWSSGEYAWGLVGDGTGMPEKSPDLQMLVEFLRTRPGNGLLYLNGDNIATELSQLTSPAASELCTFVGYDLVSMSHRATSGIAPIVIGTPLSVFRREDGTPRSFVAFGGCPRINQFDVLSPRSPATVEMEYETSSLGAVVGQATRTPAGDRLVILSGFGFEQIRDDDFDGIRDQSEHLLDILSAMEPSLPCAGTEGLIEVVPDGVAITWASGGCADLVGMRIYRALASEASPQLINEAQVPPPTGSYLDTDVSIGTRARYELRSVRTFGQEAIVDSATIVRAAAVSDFSAKSTDIDVQLQWRISDLTGLVGLGLTRSPAGQQAPVPIHGDSLLAASTIRFVDTTFEPGQAYDYQLVLHYSSGTTLGSSSLGVTAPGKFALAQNAPNPFNPSTRIRFMMPTTARAELVVFDVGGRRVRTLLAGEVEAGSAETSWDGRDQSGTPVASGIYFCRLSALGTSLTRKITLLR